MKTQVQFLLALLLVLVGPAPAGASEDFDAEVEESMSESDATSIQAKWAQERAIKEAQEAERLKKENAAFQAKATARLKQSAAELATAEKEIAALKAEQKKYKGEKAYAEKMIHKADGKLKVALGSLNKVKAENEALRKIRDEQTVKINKLGQKTKDVQVETAKLQQQLEQAKKDFQKQQANLKAAEGRLAATQVEHAKKKVEVQKTIEQLRTQHQETKRKTDIVEAEIRNKRQGIARLEEEVKVAEVEVKTGDTRLKDAEERLEGMRAKADAREADLANRKQIAEHTIESREAKEAVLRIKQAEVNQKFSRAPASDNSAMQVSLKTAGAHMTLARDCRVYEQPNDKAKVLGVKKAGSQLAGHEANNWIAFQLKDARKGYMPKGCF